MNAIVRYSSDVQMSYSVNTFMPIEGYRVAFNGTKGRLEVRDYERQPWDPGEETEMHLITQLRASGSRSTSRLRPAVTAAVMTCCGTWSSATVERAGAHEAARLARGCDVVPDGHRRAQQHRSEAAGEDL